MSSKDIVFEPDAVLERGARTEIAIAWPFLLDGHIRLQLVLDTTITGSEGGVAQARILSHHFRTRRTAEADQRDEMAAIKAPLPVVHPTLAAAHA